MVDSDDFAPGVRKSATGTASFRPPPIAGRFAKDAGNSSPGSVRLPGYSGKDYHDKLEGRERLYQPSPLTRCSRASRVPAWNWMLAGLSRRSLGHLRQAAAYGGKPAGSK